MTVQPEVVEVCPGPEWMPPAFRIVNPPAMVQDAAGDELSKSAPDVPVPGPKVGPGVPEPPADSVPPRPALPPPAGRYVEDPGRAQAAVLAAAGGGRIVRTRR